VEERLLAVGRDASGTPGGCFPGDPPHRTSSARSLSGARDLSNGRNGWKEKPFLDLLFSPRVSGEDSLRQRVAHGHQAAGALSALQSLRGEEALEEEEVIGGASERHEDGRQEFGVSG